MTNFRKRTSQSNPAIETDPSQSAMQSEIDRQNRKLEINKKMSKRIKGKAINLHNELSHLGGIRTLIVSLNDAVREFELRGHLEEFEKRALDALRQTRDLLIKEHYGLNTYNLVELLLS